MDEAIQKRRGVKGGESKEGQRLNSSAAKQKRLGSKKRLSTAVSPRRAATLKATSTQSSKVDNVDVGDDDEKKDADVAVDANADGGGTASRQPSQQELMSLPAPAMASPRPPNNDSNDKRRKGLFAYRFMNFLTMIMFHSQIIVCFG
jgi:hypothetical protein